MSGARAHLGPGLVLIFWWVGLICGLQVCSCPLDYVCLLEGGAGFKAKPDLLVDGARDSETSACPLFGRAVSQGLSVQVPRVPSLDPIHLCWGQALGPLISRGGNGLRGF